MTPPSPRLPRILVVDDEPLMRRAVRGALAHDGFQVGECADTVVAQLMHARHAFDVILFECHAPPHAPESFVRTLRARGDRVVLLACCANTSTPHKRVLLDAGIDEFLAKVDLYRELGPAIARQMARRAELPGGHCGGSAPQVGPPRAR